MLRLIRSEEPEQLLDVLALEVAAVRRRSGPLTPITLVVPHDAYAQWARQGLAVRLGVIGHLRTPRLRAWLGEVVETTHPGVELVGARAIAGALLERLHDPELESRLELAPLVRYLDAPDPGAVALRRVQLAEELGRCFEGYALERPRWLKRWRAPAPDPNRPPDEAWQATLLSELTGPGGPFEPREPEPERPARWLPLDALERIPAPWHTSTPTLLLGVPIHDAVTTEMLRRTAAGGPLLAFDPSPQPRFWEETISNPWLAWGRLGRRESRTLAEASDWTAEDALPSTHPPPTSVLDGLRASAFGLPVGPRRPPDPSLSVVGAPGLRRECEAIVDACWQHLEADPSLRLGDIAVVLATSDADTYRAQLAAAFAEADGLALHELDAPLAQDSTVIDAVRHLLALLGSAMTRQDVLRVLTHPAVRARFGLGEVTGWVDWCEQLGVLHGADARDHAETYIERDLFHWDQGMRRLALGAFLPPGHPWGDQTSHRVFAAELDPTEEASAGRLIALARSLLSDARRIATEKLRLPEWSALLLAYVDTYVGAPRAEDERHRSRVLDAIEGLSRRAPGAVPVDCATAVALLEPELSSARGHRGAPLSEGVVMGPLRALAWLPFRVVFWPGLGEGRFPTGDRRSSLDLRTVHPEAQDVGARDIELLDGLQRIVQTRDALHLSYVARDARTGEHLQPAAVLSELLEHAEREICERPISIDGLPPRWEDARASSGAALSERAASELGALLRTAGVPTAHGEDWAEVLGEAQARELRVRLETLTPPKPTERSSSIRISLAVLRRFLEEPAQGWARQALRLDEETARPEEVAARIDEQFELPRRDSSTLLSQVFLPWLGRGLPTDALLASYEAAADRQEASGRLPTGVFGEATRRRHREALEAWRQRSYEAFEGAEPQLTRLELGRPGRPALAGAERLPAFELGSIRLVGTTEAGPTHGGSLTFVNAAPSGTHARMRIELRAWISVLVHAALGRSTPGTWWARIAPADGEALLTTGLVPPPGPEARAILTRMCDRLSGPPPSFRLPLRTQLLLHAERAKGAHPRRLEGLLQRSEPDRFGPLEPFTLAPPELDVAFEHIDAVLTPFIDARGGHG